MARSVIRDYLNTQNLALNADEVQVAHLTLNAVFNVAEPEGLPENLWWVPAGPADAPPLDLRPVLPDTPAVDSLLRGVYTVLDSVLSRHPADAVAVYVKQMVAGGNRLLCLSQRGQPLPVTWPIQPQDEQQPLLARVAHTAWATVIDNAPQWLAWGDLVAEDAALGASQLVLPMLDEQGRLTGVLAVGDARPRAWSAEEQCWWVAAALTLGQALSQALPPDWWPPQEEV